MELRFTYGNGAVADFGYNDHFETTSIRYSKTAAPDLLNLAYNYGTQNNGEISAITDTLDPTRSMTYTYDAWSRRGGPAPSRRSRAPSKHRTPRLRQI